MRPRKLAFRNNIAVFGWVFMAVWTAMLGVFTWLFIREGGFQQFHLLVEVVVMALFWLFGCAYLFSKLRIHLTIEGKEVVVTERWLWRLRPNAFR